MIAGIVDYMYKYRVQYHLVSMQYLDVYSYLFSLHIRYDKSVGARQFKVRSERKREMRELKVRSESGKKEKRQK